MSEQDDIYGLCGCGLMLHKVRDASGVQIGVTHPDPDHEDHHLRWGAGLVAAVVDGKLVISEDVPTDGTVVKPHHEGMRDERIDMEKTL